MKNVYLLILISVLFIGIFNYYLHLFSKKKGISNKFKNLLVYFLSSLLIFIFLDFYVFKLFGHGFPSSISEEKFERSPSPYDSFSGKPFYKDHNSLGFRGIEFKNDDNTLQIAFFGGSTGYNGEPPIIDLIEKNLNKKNILLFDAKISPSALNENFFSEINSLSPFGSGNPEPKFVVENLELLKSSVVADKHIRSLLSAPDGSALRSIAFNAIKSDLETYLLSKNRKKFNILGKLSLNEWKGQKKVEFIIDDISVNKAITNTVPSSNG